MMTDGQLEAAGVETHSLDRTSAETREAPELPAHLSGVAARLGTQRLVNPYKHMTVKHHRNGGIYTKECHLPVGYWFAQHRHSFDHQSVLVSGTAIVEVDGEQTEHTGPTILNIKAKKTHTIIPLTPVVWLCQHVTACTDPEDIDLEFIDHESPTGGM